MDECLFCGIAAKSIPAKIVHEDETIVAFEDIHPQAPVHLLVIPRVHVSSLNDAREDDAECWASCRRGGAPREGEGIAVEGYRTVVNTMAGAGQTVFPRRPSARGRRMSWRRADPVGPGASVPRSTARLGGDGNHSGALT
jgi:histidine triad (HIT) family protein